MIRRTSNSTLEATPRPEPLAALTAARVAMSLPSALAYKAENKRRADDRGHGSTPSRSTNISVPEKQHHFVGLREVVGLVDDVALRVGDQEKRQTDRQLGEPRVIAILREQRRGVVDLQQDRPLERAVERPVARHSLLERLAVGAPAPVEVDEHHLPGPRGFLVCALAIEVPSQAVLGLRDGVAAGGS